MSVMPFLKASKRLLLPLVYGLANIGYAIWPRHLPRQSQLPVGINFIGYYAAELGLGQALRSAVHGFLEMRKSRCWILPTLMPASPAAVCTYLTRRFLPPQAPQPGYFPRRYPG